MDNLMNNTFIFEHDFEELKKYWMSLYETEQLNPDETIRIVPQIKKNDENKVFTANNQLNSFNSLKEYITRLDAQNGTGNVGYSISSSIFKYNPENKDANGYVVKPSTNTFEKIKKIVIDIDFHIQNSKDRFILGYLEETYIKFALISVYLNIVEKFKENDFPVIRPSIAGLTGSGLQIVFTLDRWINKDEANVFFTYFKNLIAKRKEFFDILVKDTLGNLNKISAEIDPTFADIAHVQRAFGTINQKYGVQSRSVSVFEFNEVQENLEDVRNNFIDFIKESNFPIATVDKYIKYVNHIIERVKTLIINESKNHIEVDKFLTIAKMEQYSNKTLIKPSELKSIESELLYKLKENGIQSADIVRDHVTIDHESSRFIALKCPFHEDSKYSFAIYVNDSMDVFYDFHDSKSYTLITFWEKLFNVNKTTAISQIAQKAGIKLGKSERKDFEDLEIEEIIDHLLDKIDTENYVYYRLANKNRVCVVRHKDSGEAFVFDGPKMLAHHVLENQLSIDDVDRKFVMKFQEKFEEKVLMDAFEEFHPGKPTVFQREFIKFVNLWVPSKNYKDAHIRKAEYESIPLKKSIDVIKDKCPWTFKYLQQLSQKGNLLWFINWIANGAHFNVMPTIPVVFGTPGVGKNLFINTIMEWYHNSEYTKILNTDRVMSNFNSVLESASMVVLDEGDISSGKDFDALKFLSGNTKIAIEKKGVDVQMKERYFNIVLFSNGEVPVRHAYNDRRIQYFYTEKTLLQSCQSWEVSIEEFVDHVKEELIDFWAILLNIEPDLKWNISNEKDKLFLTQILKQHSFGELVLKLLKGEWKDIGLQLNENVQDPSLMKANLELLKTIKTQFESNGKISLTLINRYLNALNFRYKTSVQHFIKHNNLIELGVSIDVDVDDVYIIINKRKLNSLSRIPNLLEVDSNYNKAINKIINFNSESLKAEKEMENVSAKVTIENQEDKITGQSNPIETEFDKNNLTPPPPPVIEGLPI